MKVVFSFEEMSKVLLEYVQKNMNVHVNHVEIPTAYSHRDDFCVITQKNEDKN
jgi:Tfp pilus assembly ATPase PilU